ncbi:Fasciclin-like arabinogalactan protein 8 [Cardamine amara subsp. amara]|uniref:Fasciclin-like arabinogalactan protein 8 n=1 Tax=Cardamine amara subsp. amara TaxID=228776 RepID=A0ABD1BPS6_CARAN
MAPSRVLSLLALTLSLLAVASTVSGHNITQILSDSPDYSSFNSYLSQTNLTDEINNRTTITVLVLNNAAMSSLAGTHPLSVIKNALSLLVLLDYYDPLTLHQLSEGTTLTTTLYQTTGNATGNQGFVNITDLKGGKVGFGSAAPRSKLDSTYTKSVKQIPYNISVLEIDAPIIAPGILSDITPPPAPAPAPEAVSAPTPTPAKSQSPAEEPSRAAASPPAPPEDDSPEGAPSDSPTSSEKSNAKNAAFHVNAPALFTVLVTLAATFLLL